MKKYTYILTSLIILLAANMLILNSSYFNERSIINSQILKNYVNSIIEKDAEVKEKEKAVTKVLAFYDEGLEPQFIKINDIKEFVIASNLISIAVTFIIWIVHYAYLLVKEEKIVLIFRIALLFSSVWIVFIVSVNLVSRSMREVLIIGLIPTLIILGTLWILRKEKSNIIDAK